MFALVCSLATFIFFFILLNTATVIHCKAYVTVVRNGKSWDKSGANPKKKFQKPKFFEFSTQDSSLKCLS